MKWVSEIVDDDEQYLSGIVLSSERHVDVGERNAQTWLNYGLLTNDNGNVTVAATIPFRFD